jgi:hypothetical protein
MLEGLPLAHAGTADGLPRHANVDLFEERLEVVPTYKIQELEALDTDLPEAVSPDRCCRRTQRGA